MNITIKYGLPFVSIAIRFRSKDLTLENVLLDTGSAGTIFNADVVGAIGVKPEAEDVVDTIRGVGGVEYVYTKIFDAICFDEGSLNHFQVEVGNMDYGMDIDGILGFDFIQSAQLMIDTVQMKVYSPMQ